MEVGVGQARWSRWHKSSPRKNAKEASIHLHLSLLILALTFQHWQVKSSVTVWRDAMQGRLLNRALTAFDRYHVFALSHQTQNRGRYNLLPHARHAMPLWPDWVCVHKQRSEVTGNPKCHLKVGLWLITPYLGDHGDKSETPANKKKNAKATTESFRYDI